MKINNNQSKLNLTVYATSFLIIVSVGRVHELFPFLEGVPLGKAALIVGFLSLFFSIRESTEKLKYTSIIKIIVAIFILAILSVSFSVYKTESLNFLTTSLVGIFLLLYLTIKTCNNFAVIQRYLVILIASAAILAYGVLKEGGEGRLSVGETLDPNDLALFLVTIVPIVFTQIFIVKKLIKIIFAVIVGLLLLGIMLTGSRGGFLGLFTVAVFMLVQKFPLKSGGYIARFSLGKTFLIIAAVILMYYIAPSSYWERIETIFNPSQDYNVDDDRGRLAIWQQGIDMTLDNPWGIGIGAFASGQGMLEGGYYQTAHNSLILIAGELGFLGLFLYLLLYFKAISFLNRIIQDKTGVLSFETKFTAIGLRTGLLGFFVSSFFLSQAYSPLLYVIYAIIDRMIILNGLNKAK